MAARTERMRVFRGTEFGAATRGAQKLSFQWNYSIGACVIGVLEYHFGVQNG
jgi:hypothetical protein